MRSFAKNGGKNICVVQVMPDADVRCILAKLVSRRMKISLLESKTANTYWLR